MTIEKLQNDSVRIKALCDAHNIGAATRPDGVVRIDLGPSGQSAKTLQEAERILKLYGRL